MAFSNSCIDKLMGMLMVDKGLFTCWATTLVGTGAFAVFTLQAGRANKKMTKNRQK